MAEVEDYADFGSHFLDSLLEVQMTVEDGELEVPPEKEDQPVENPYTDFPPIPTFDLQSDVFRNPMAVAPSLQPAPMLTIHSKDIMSANVLQPPPLIASGNYIQTTIPSQIISSSVQQIMARPVVKTVVSSTPKIVSTTSLAKDPIPEINLKTEFTNRLFRNEYVKVFVTGDPPRDIAAFQTDEIEYYNVHFRNIENIKYCKIHCTICDKHLGCGVDVENKAMVHSYLKVLTCKACFEFYGDGNFPCDEVDNCEIYCRWCGQGGALVCCSFCPRVFCKKCVRRNYGQAFLRNVERANDWACFCCSQKPLWPHRAICRALMEYITTRKKTPNNSLPRKDISTCCEKKKPQPPPQPQPQQLQQQQPQQPQQPLTPQQQQIQHMQQLQLRKRDSIPQSVTLSSQKDTSFQIIGSPEPLKKLVLPLSKTINNNFKNNLPQIKISDQNKSPIRIVKTVGAGSGSNLKNNILRNYNSLPIAKVFSPSSIQAPVMHGQTVITPPASRQQPIIRPKPPPSQQQVRPSPRPGPASKTQPQAQSGQQKSPFVMVSLSNQSNPVDLSKIPTAKIPHNVQGLILRMNFPDNKVQLVRLVTEGNGCKAGKTFPMPEFKKAKEADFLENHLENSFKLSKILFDRLMLIKDKISSKNKNTEGSIYSSSVKKLHVIYEKTSELLKELDGELLKQFEDWKKAKEGGVVDVIDLSDEEKSPKKSKSNSNFDEITKELLLENADSDVEIIDDEKNREEKLQNGEKTEDEESRSQDDFTDLKDKYNLKELSVKVVRLPVKRRRSSSSEDTISDENNKKSKMSDDEDEAYDAKTDDEGSDKEEDKQETENAASELSESAGREENKICENGEITEEEENQNEDTNNSEDLNNEEEKNDPLEYSGRNDETNASLDDSSKNDDTNVSLDESSKNDDTNVPSDDVSKGENENSCQK